MANNTNDKKRVYRLALSISDLFGEFCKDSKSMTSPRLDELSTLVDIASRTFQKIEGPHAKLIGISNPSFVYDPLQPMPRFARVLPPYSSSGKFDASQTYSDYLRGTEALLAPTVNTAHNQTPGVVAGATG